MKHNENGITFSELYQERAQILATVMTTGRSGEFKTPLGTIEFTHTKRDPVDIIENTIWVDRPLRLATKQTAYRDLKRVGRNTHLVNKEELYDEL